MSTEREQRDKKIRNGLRGLQPAHSGTITRTFSHDDHGNPTFDNGRGPKIYTQVVVRDTRGGIVATAPASQLQALREHYAVLRRRGAVVLEGV